jgi:hypothetical protein
VPGDVIDRERAPLGGPPLTDLGHHSDQRVGVDRRHLRVVAGVLELVAEHVVDPLREIVDHPGQAAPRGGVR